MPWTVGCRAVEKSTCQNEQGLVEMRKQLSSVLVCCELFSFALGYSRVSTNGQARASATRDVAFTVSPIYVATPRTVDLKPGEAVNHPSTPKYSTLDEELLTKLNGRNGAQERFHPPASFEHALSHSNGLRQQSNDDVIYPKPLVSMTYDYPTSNLDDSKAIGSSSTDSFPTYSQSKPADLYSNGKDAPPSDYGGKPFGFELDHPPKSLDFPGHYADAAPYHEDELIYDHVPEHHHHHYKPTTTTTEEPMDQRLNKRPYSYYYIGKKLWYVPLYFSIYFIIYIAALVLKSIARHKINFPASLAAAAEGARAADGPGWMDYVTRVLEAVEKYGSLT